MFTDYATLQTEIQDWFDRPDLAGKAATFIAFGEACIYRDLRVRQMEKALSGTLASGVFAIPSDWIEAKHLRVVGSPDTQLDRMDPGELYATYPRNGFTGVPAYFARDAGNLVFGPTPDTNYSIAGTYYARLPSLSGTNTTNWLITDVPGLTFAAAMREASAYMQDAEAVAFWEAKYQAYKTQIQAKDDAEQFSGAPALVKLG